MDVLFFNQPFCKGQVIFLSKIVDINVINNNIIYIDNENMFDLKSWANYKPYCIIVNYSTMLSHIVSYCISNSIAVISLKRSILQQIEGQIVTFDFISGEIKDGETTPNIDNNLHSTEFSNLNKLFTKDGKEVQIYATVKSIENAFEAKKMQIENAGLVCTEFFVTETSSLQFTPLFNTICDCFKSGTTAIRLFDYDKNKIFTKTDFNTCERGIRAASNSIVFQIIKKQVRSIIEISKKHSVSLVIPYITNLKDILLVEKLVSKLKNNNIPIPLSAMIETPAAFFSIPQMSNYVSSFSIGTNDLISAFFCTNRDSILESTNYCSPYNWSLINLLYSYPCDFISKTRICGQLPLYPFMLEVLVSLGFTKFSVPPPIIPSIAKRISGFSTIQGDKILETTMDCSNEQEMITQLSNMFT